MAQSISQRKAHKLSDLEIARRRVRDLEDDIAVLDALRGTGGSATLTRLAQEEVDARAAELQESEAVEAESEPEPLSFRNSIKTKDEG